MADPDAVAKEARLDAAVDRIIKKIGPRHELPRYKGAFRVLLLLAADVQISLYAVMCIHCMVVTLAPVSVRNDASIWDLFFSSQCALLAIYMVMWLASAPLLRFRRTLNPGRLEQLGIADQLLVLQVLALFLCEPHNKWPACALFALAHLRQIDLCRHWWEKKTFFLPVLVKQPFLADVLSLGRRNQQ